MVTARARPGQIVPVDSEHSALAQCLRGGSRGEVRRLVLTASGGPFRGRSREELHDVTPAEALAHPTWDMGPLVTINSATLVNKGLEVIEAHLLFDLPFDRIDVVVHPTSVVHSMVEFVDGSTLAQASPPSMMIPIALGLGWPDRVADSAPAVDWTRPQAWEFFPLDDDAFPAVRLAREAGQAGSTAPGGLQRRQRGVRRGVPRRCDALHGHRAHDRPGAGASTTYSRRSTSSPSTTFSPRTRGPGTGLASAVGLPPRCPSPRSLDRMTPALYLLGVLVLRRRGGVVDRRCTRWATWCRRSTSA